MGWKFLGNTPRKANTPGWNKEKMEKMRGVKRPGVNLCVARPVEYKPQKVLMPKDFKPYDPKNPRPMLLNIPPQNDMVQQLGIKAAPSTKDVKAKQQEKKLAQQQKKEKEEFQTLILNQGKPLTKDQKDFNEVIGAK